MGDALNKNNYTLLGRLNNDVSDPTRQELRCRNLHVGGSQQVTNLALQSLLTWLKTQLIIKFLGDMAEENRRIKLQKKVSYWLKILI